MPKVKFPEFNNYKSFKGLFVGGCVERGDGSSFRAKAHAHTDKGDPYKGWICVRSTRRLRMHSGRPSHLMWHELAHLISGTGHNDKWREVMKSLNSRIEWRYTKENNQLKRIGIYANKKIGKKEVKRLLKRGWKKIN